MTREQLATLGVSRGAIRHQVASGYLIEVFHGVYAVGHPPTNPIDRAHGALLAAGSGSALSNRSAGSLLGSFRRWTMPLEVTVPTDRRPRGLIVHHSRKLTPQDFVTIDGLRSTGPARTLLDIAPLLSSKRLTRVMNELRLAHGLQLGDLESLLERFPRHPGAKLVRTLVSTAPSQPTRSALEDEWPPFAVVYELPPYLMNQVICGHRVDVVFLPNLLIVELDGWTTHATPPSFEADRAQDAEILARTGIPTLRITYRQFHDSPRQQAERILAILAARRLAA